MNVVEMLGGTFWANVYFGVALGCLTISTICLMIIAIKHL